MIFSAFYKGKRVKLQEGVYAGRKPMWKIGERLVAPEEVEIIEINGSKVSKEFQIYQQSKRNK